MLMKLGLIIVILIITSFTFSQEIKTEPIIEQPTERLFVFYTYGMIGPKDLIREKILEN